MRPLLVILHRWFGLVGGLFLLQAGLTGAVISWDHELDDWLNPHLHQAPAGPARPALELARQVEARHPQVRVSFLPLAAEPGESLAMGVAPRLDAESGRLFAPGFNQVFVAPATGEELGHRQWGAVWPITRETFVSFLYKLHFSLHLPEMFGTNRWGIWLLGIVAIGWTLDCFVGAWLTLPSRRRGRAADEQLADDAAPAAKGFWRRWQPAWRVRRRGGPYKLNYDLHRAAGLWTWGLLLLLAFTAFSLNLYREVFFPLMSTVSPVTPSPFDLRPPTPLHQPIAPALALADIVTLAQAEARRRGWAEPAGSIFYAQNYGIHGVQFFHPGAHHGSGGVGHKALYFDGRDGHLLGERLPWQGTAADLFVQAQFPLHSGRILGLPGRILVSVMGLVVAMLSLTGIYVWWKKRRARKSALAGRRSGFRKALPCAERRC